MKVSELHLYLAMYFRDSIKVTDIEQSYVAIMGHNFYMYDLTDDAQ